MHALGFPQQQPQQVFLGPLQPPIAYEDVESDGFGSYSDAVFPGDEYEYFRVDASEIVSMVGGPSPARTVEIMVFNVGTIPSAIDIQYSDWANSPSFGEVQAQENLFGNGAYFASFAEAAGYNTVTVVPGGQVAITLQVPGDTRYVRMSSNGGYVRLQLTSNFSFLHM